MGGIQELSDREIIEFSLKTPETFASLFDRHEKTVFRYLQRRIGPQRAEDLLSETFVRAFEGRRRFDSSHESALPWLLGIATNLLRNQWRAERRMLRAYARSGTDPVWDECDVAIDAMDASRLGPRLARELTRLRRGDREVLLLSAWAELSDQEIAEALGIPNGTVRSRLSRARAEMREQISVIGEYQAEQPKGEGNQK